VSHDRPRASDGWVHGVVAVVERGGRFLMIRRAPGVIAPGAWCFVGGAVEPGESQADALVREFAEEVGGRIRPVACVWQDEQPEKRLRLFWWRAELDETLLRPNESEVAEIAWLTPAEIRRTAGVLEGNLRFLDAYRPQAGEPH